LSNGRTYQEQNAAKGGQKSFHAVCLNCEMKKNRALYVAVTMPEKLK
jgi:hypothetical protein